MDLIPEVTLYDKIQIKKEFIKDPTDLQQFVYRLDDSFVSTVQEDDEHYYLGIGCLDRLNVENIIDNRINKKLDQKINFKANLHPAQQRTLEQFGLDFGSGILKAKCGWGKSFMGTKMVCDSFEPTIILLHTKLLMDQWNALFKECTDYEPGIVGDGIFNPKDVTIGLYLSVNNRLEELRHRYTRVIVDEVHRCGADLFSDTLTKFAARYKQGMSATPSRRDGRHVLFPDYFTNRFIVAEEYRDLIKPFVEIKKVPLKFDVLNPTTDWARALTKAFSNENYLRMIANDTKELMDDGRTCLILAPRVEALEYLQKLIPRSVVLTGKVTKGRQEIVDKIGTEYNCVLTTTIFR